MYSQDRIRDADIENGQVDRGRGGGWWNQLGD